MPPLKLVPPTCGPHYIYPYEVVSEQEIDEAVFSESDEYIVAYKTEPKIGDTFSEYWMLYHPSDGAIVGFSGYPHISQYNFKLFLKYVK